MRSITVQEKKEVKCPFLGGTYFFSCRKNHEVYVPSSFEAEEYCMSFRYKVCPFYCEGRPRYLLTEMS